MPVPTGAILERVDAVLSVLPGVFSTAQWGGRAYKLPGPGGSLKRPKLVAFVVVLKDNACVEVSFKLSKERAAAVVKGSDFIRPNSFSSLGKAGWLEARLTRVRQVAVLRRLLVECRAMYGGQDQAVDHAACGPANPIQGRRETSRAPGRSPTTVSPANPVAARIARVAEAARHELGWSPAGRDDF